MLLKNLLHSPLQSLWHAPMMNQVNGRWWGNVLADALLRPFFIVLRSILSCRGVLWKDWLLSAPAKDHLQTNHATLVALLGELGILKARIAASGCVCVCFFDRLGARQEGDPIHHISYNTIFIGRSSLSLSLSDITSTCYLSHTQAAVEQPSLNPSIGMDFPRSPIGCWGNPHSTHSRQARESSPKLHSRDLPFETRRSPLCNIFQPCSCQATVIQICFRSSPWKRYLLICHVRNAMGERHLGNAIGGLNHTTLSYVVWCAWLSHLSSDKRAISSEHACLSLSLNTGCMTMYLTSHCCTLTCFCQWWRDRCNTDSYTESISKRLVACQWCCGINRAPRSF